MILTNKQVNDLKAAVEQALIARGSLYDGQIRLLFCRGIPVTYWGGLPTHATPAIQLDLDLTNFNTVERLADGVVPLELWLRNALNFLQNQTQAAVLQEMLDIVSSRMSGAPPVQDPTAPNLPLGSLPRGLEKTVDRDDTLPFVFIEGARRVGLAVAQLKVPEFEFGQIKLNGADPILHVGSGWLVTPSLIMTNWHVVNARDEGANGVVPAAAAGDFELQAKTLHAVFDFDDNSRPGTKVPASNLEATDQTLDYAIVRLKQPITGRTPLTLAKGKVEVRNVNDYQAVNIIQHPGGGPKRVAIRNNLIYRATYPALSYFTDTEGGSSGAPVCTDDWQVVALHRSWKAVRNVQFQGKLTPCVNEGTQVAAIMEHVKQSYPSLYTEIVGA